MDVMTLSSAPAIGPPNGRDLTLPQVESTLTERLWKEVPAWSWRMSLDDGSLQMHCLYGGARIEEAGPELRSALASRLRKRMREAEGDRPQRLLEMLPTEEGQRRYFLVFIFPANARDGVQQLSGVAINITQHQGHMDDLVRQAHIDELTGLYNRRGFFLFAEREFRLARRHGTRSAVLFVDVDGLKRTNDLHGHERGSDLIVETAFLLQRVFRDCDVIARVGGDEFAVFAADVRGDPESLATRLARAVAKSAADGRSKLALSAGVGSGIPGPTLHLVDLLRSADQAMYRNKLGKSRSTRHSSLGVQRTDTAGAAA